MSSQRAELNWVSTWWHHSRHDQTNVSLHLSVPRVVTAFPLQHLARCRPTHTAADTEETWVPTHRLQWRAAEVLGMCVQNHPEVQQWALDGVRPAGALGGN